MIEDNYNSEQLDKLVNEIEGRLNDFDNGITDKDETIKIFAELVIKCAKTAVDSSQAQAWTKGYNEAVDTHERITQIQLESAYKKQRESDAEIFKRYCPLAEGGRFIYEDDFKTYCKILANEIKTNINEKQNEQTTKV